MIYGPSTAGMFKEFFVQGEVTANQPLRHQRTGQDTTVREVTGDDYVRRIQPSMKGAEAAPSVTVPLFRVPSASGAGVLPPRGPASPG